MSCVALGLSVALGWVILVLVVVAFVRGSGRRE